MPRRLLLSLAFAVGALGGCFLSPNVPPSFRYSCQTDDDCAVLTCLDDTLAWPIAKARGLKQGCDSDEAKASPSGFYGYRQQCVAGLCQYPCALESFSDDCPSGKGYNFCLNGSCSTLCGTDPARFPDPDATCPDPQKCVIFGEDIDLGPLQAFLGGGGGGGGSSSPFGGGSSSIDINDLEGAGVCGVRCDAEGAPPCAPGQYCSGAMCLPGCSQPGATPCLDGQQCVEISGFSACLTTCDPNVATSCPEDQVCAPLVNVCVARCVGADAVACQDGFTCDPDYEICVPDDVSTTGIGTSG
jgi:hypothetical protein